MHQWLLIDGNSWFAMDWYAAKGRAVTNFELRLATMRSQFGFDRVVVAWDGKRSFRRDLCETYKTHRGAKPEGFEMALDKCKEALARLVQTIEVDGFEGDDIVATLVDTAREEGVQAVIASADKDLHQLLERGRVSQVTSMKRITHARLHCNTVTEDDLIAKYGVRPNQWVDYRVMIGDPSDGIVGFHGIGETIATEVLQRCQTLEGFYSRVWSVSAMTNRQRTIMLANKDKVDALRALLTLRRDVPLPSQWFSSAAV